MVELKRLELFAEEETRYFKDIDEQLRNCDSDIKRYQHVVRTADGEREAVLRSMQDFEESKRIEMEELNSSLTATKERNVELQTNLADKENQARKFGKEASELEQALKRQTEELAKLKQMKDGDPAQVDEILREKQAMILKREALTRLNQEYMQAISVADEELLIARKQCMQSENAQKDYETRVSKLGVQKTEAVFQGQSRIKELEKIRSEISRMEDERMQITTRISASEFMLSGTLGKELKEQSRIQRTLESTLQSLHRTITEKLTELREAEQMFQNKTSKLNSVSTQNEFMENEIQALEDQTSEYRKRFAKINLEHNELSKSDISREVDERDREIENLRVQLEQINVEMKFLKDHDMVGADGFIKPLIITSKEGEPLVNSLVEQLGINDFLTRVQAETDLNSVIVQMVEKISQMLQLIHEADELEQRYMEDSEKAAKIIEKLKTKNRANLAELDHLETFKRMALVQIGLNILQASKGINLFLQGLAYGDNELGDLLNRLSVDEKQKMTKVNLSNCKLVDFQLVRLVSEFQNLRELDLRGMPDLTGILELERHLKTKVEGITGVYRDDKVLIVNSGLQVRLTVYHGLI